MSLDLFSRSNALKLLHNKQIWFFGDSNTRSMYKDLVWLLQNGTMIPQASLKVKNELTHANDFKTSNSPLTAGRDYVETREYYKAGTAVSFTFLTKVFSQNLTDAFDSKPGVTPDVVVFNSCVWDLSRWGPNGVAEYKKNVVSMLEFFKKRLSRNCLVIFMTTLPLSADCRGGFLKKEVEFLRYQLPWHVIEANYFMATMAKLYQRDVLDLHYYMRFFREEWSPDGIHWSPLGYRLITNFLLTHLALSFNVPLPGVYSIDENFIQKSQNASEKRKEIENVGSNEAKRLRYEPNLLLENKKCDGVPAVVDKNISESTQTKQANFVTKQTNQGDKLVETKLDLSLTKQPEVVASSQDCFVEAGANNGLVDSECECNNKNISDELNLNTKIENNNIDNLNLQHSEPIDETKQLIVASNQDSFVETGTPDLSSSNTVVDLVDSKCECNNENNNNIITDELNINIKIDKPHSGSTEKTKQLNDGVNVANKVTFSTIDLTSPNKHLNSIKTVCIYEPIKTNPLIGSGCFNGSIEALKVPIKELCDVVQTKNPNHVETVTYQPNLSQNCESQETNLASFLKDNFNFSFFIESFSPQLDALK